MSSVGRDGIKRPLGIAVLPDGTRMPYHQYMQPYAWDEKKRKFGLSNQNNRCCYCNAKYVDIHHKTYKNLGNEKMTDLMALCREHHKQIHDLVKEGKQLWSAGKWMPMQVIATRRRTAKQLLKRRLRRERRREITRLRALRKNDPAYLAKKAERRAQKLKEQTIS